MKKFPSFGGVPDRAGWFPNRSIMVYCIMSINRRCTAYKEQNRLSIAKFMTTVLETSRVKGLRTLNGVAWVFCLLCALFSIIFFGLLIYNYLLPYRPAMTLDVTESPAEFVPSDRKSAFDPFNILPTEYAEFVTLKRELASDKNNENLKTQIRELDRQLRVDYFKRREFIRLTAPLLFFAVIGFLLSARTIAVLNRNIPQPVTDCKCNENKRSKEHWRLVMIGVTAVATGLVGLSVGLFLSPPSDFEKILAAKADEIRRASTTSGEKSPVETPPKIAAESVFVPLDRDTFFAEQAKNWPSFRGANGGGKIPTGVYPTHWNGVTGEKILWKSEVPLPGKSSPIVWGDKVFVTGADAGQRQVFCYDINDGKLLWTADAPSTSESTKEFEVDKDVGFAAPTAVTDGRHVFAIFANGDLVAVHLNGKIAWSKSLGIPDSHYGFSSSPTLYFDKLIVQYDFGDGTEGHSKILAFDTATGEIVWETPRETPNTWSSPIVQKIAGKYQLITCGDPFAVAYDPENGSEIWRCKCLSQDIGPSPVANDEIAFIVNTAPRASAIKADGSGDVSKTHLLWTGSNALPDAVSPVVGDKYFLTLDSYGYLTGYDLSKISNNKAKYWELEVGGGGASFYSSPLLVGDILYLFDKSEKDARAFVYDLSKIEFNDEGELTEESQSAMLLSTNPMPEPCETSPAPVAGKILIRGSQTLFCIGE